MYPEVSIIIPAYNHQNYVESAVLSALLQTYKQIEIILIDDGSTDSTGAICEKLAMQYRSIRYFSHSNMGAHNTINKGIQAASGQFISILNSDDLFLPGKIERCIEIIKNNMKTQLISGNVQFIDASGNRYLNDVSIEWQNRGHRFLDSTGLFPLSILNENFIATTSNLFFTKALWNKLGGFKPLRYCHDLDFLMSSYRSCDCYYDRESYHIKYRVHDSNTIKEDLSNIRVEIAAVIASSLILDNLKLIEEFNSVQLNHILRFLKNKNDSNLIILLMMYYIKFGNKEEFYKHLYKKDIKKIFSNLINNDR
jgi:glycosyltransferase involved in cell wall biosynthesis